MATQDQNTSAASNLQKVIDEQRAQLEQKDSYIKALVSEFESCDDIEEIRTKFREKVAEYAPTALTNIFHMCDFAESESVKAGLNKWVIDWAMSDKIDTTANELAGLLKGLSKKPANPAQQETTEVSGE